MYEKIKAALMGNVFLPQSTKRLLLEFGQEFDRLDAEVKQLRSQIEKE